MMNKEFINTFGSHTYLGADNSIGGIFESKNLFN